MSDVKTFTRSFAGGVVSPEMAARVDDAKNQTGLRVCRNFIVKPTGPIANRGGTLDLASVKTPAKATRLWSFLADADEGFAVEIGHLYFRFFYQGAAVLASPGGAPVEVVHPYDEADLAGLKIIQSNDVWTITHPGYPPAELRRTAATTWVYQTISFASALTAPGSVSATATPAVSSPGTPTLQSYVVTAVNGADEGPASNYDAGSGSTAIPTGGFSVFDATNANPGVFTVYEVPDAALTTGQAVYLSGFGGGFSVLNGTFKEVLGFTWIDEPGIPGLHTGFELTLRNTGGGANVDTSSYGTYVGGGTIAISSGGSVSTNGVGTCSNNLFDSGAYNTITWAAVAGAERYNVYKLTSGLFGYIGQTQALTFTDDNIAADIAKTPPIQDNPFSATGKHPAAVGYHEQRRWFAGGIDNPNRAWSTRTGTESNLAYSIPSRDDDSIRFALAARERQSIRHIVPLSALLFLSDAAEWVATPGSADVLTPDIALRAQSFIGAAEATPVIVNNSVIFAAARGGHVRELAYNDSANGFLTGDITIRAAHLFDDYTVTQFAYSKSPLPIVWAVSSSGSLLGLTYVPEEQIGAWHEHTTQGGIFESVCVVPEGEDDVLYAIVKRGSTRRVERMHTRRSTDSDDVPFLDCAKTYSGAPATTFTGLSHLEGQTVSIIADRRVLDSQVVSGGAITLGTAASDVIVGLPVVAEIETLPLAYEAPGYGQGETKNITKLWVKTWKSRGYQAGPAGGKLTTLHPLTAWGEPPEPTDRIDEIRFSGSWNQEGALRIVHTDPTPLTVLGMVIGFARGG